MIITGRRMSGCCTCYFYASNDVFDIIHSRTDAIRTYPNARLQRRLTDVNTHKLTATISVYPAKFTKQAPNDATSLSNVTMATPDCKSGTLPLF